ncbi:MAG: threonylcarbamoyl-AMP synthase [Lachnospiraceae bacterium]|nr:threonylcarbamoyl-AMP synthase [Lachnospiraceae bacterium]
MKTRFCRLSGGPEDEEIYREAGTIIREGGLVAFPTETVYGLGGNGLSGASSAKIYAAKGRPSDNPLILHIAGMEELPALVSDIPDAAKRLAEAFWPGPMTLIFRKSSLVPPETTGGLDTVAVRMPSHPAAQRFIRAAGVPIAAPSANLSGRPSPTTAKHVREDLDGRIDMILDGGPADIGLESTIIDVTEETPVILRPGYIGREALETLLGKVELDRAVFAEPAQGVKPKAPGMKYRHYAPKAEMTLVEGTFAAEAILKEAAASARAGRRTGILCSEETKDRYSPLAEELGAEGFSLKLFCAGRRSDPESIAHRLFGLLRQFDEDGIEVVWAESFDEGGIGTAVMNRLRKAAGYRIMRT